MTKLEWYARLRSWVPGWVFEEEKANVALFMGMARVLELIQSDVEILFGQTMIDEAESPFLELHGDERNVFRISGESDAAFRIKIKTKSTKPQVSLPDIELIVNSLITEGVARIIEDWKGDTYCDRGSFLNRRNILVDPIDHAFTILVDTQSDTSIFQILVEAVNRAKAFGVVYRIVERIGEPATLSTEDGDTLITEDGDELTV